MVDINKNAETILNDLVERYCGYRQKGEYGTSSFWNWYYQVRNYIYALDKYDTPLGNNQIYKMKFWGNIIYSRKIVNGEVFVVITGFKFNKPNFNKWINHKSLSRNPYVKIDDAGYGYSIVRHDDNGKYAITTPQNKLLCNAVFDEMIGFYHNYGYSKNPTAIGFIGNRVYSIEMNGNITMLRMSKEYFLNMKQQNEVRQQFKDILTECIKTVLNKMNHQTFLKLINRK